MTSAKSLKGHVGEIEKETEGKCGTWCSRWQSFGQMDHVKHNLQMCILLFLPETYISPTTYYYTCV